MKYYVVDTFTDTLFSGNPAGVCVLDEPISPAVMQKIAQENNLPETAFVIKAENGYHLRWFTPNFEVDLCGHATLGTAFVLANFVEPGVDNFHFSTQSGPLLVTKSENLYEMDFPSRPPERIGITESMLEAIGLMPIAAYSSRDLILVVETEQQVRGIIPNYVKMSSLTEWLGIVVTAKGESCDFTSRFFCPELNVEDPVTGSSHCSLIPYWSERLKKSKLVAKQLSPRGGTLYCKQAVSRVQIGGHAVLYAKGELFL